MIYAEIVLDYGRFLPRGDSSVYELENHLDLQPVLKSPLVLSPDFLESPLHMSIVLQSQKYVWKVYFSFYMAFLFLRYLH